MFQVEVRNPIFLANNGVLAEHRFPSLDAAIEQASHAVETSAAKGYGWLVTIKHELPSEPPAACERPPF